MSLIQLNCQHCNGQLEIDIDNLTAVCPYCDQKLLIDVEQLSTLLVEKEKTKREHETTERMIIKHKQEKEDTKNSVKIVFLCFGFTVLIGLLLLVLDKINFI